MRKRVVIIGMGDTGLLSAIHLSSVAQVTAISTKPCMLSGQELGMRLSRPKVWVPVSMFDFSRYRKLEGVEVLHGRATSIETKESLVRVTLATGEERALEYDALLIASGVSNGFWRTAHLESREMAENKIKEQAAQIAAAQNIGIVGGGPSSVSSASNIKRRYPEKEINLFFSKDQVLAGYHPTTRKDAMRRLQRDGVLLHPNHRASISENFAGETMTTAPIHWDSGQAPFEADLVLWAIGRVRPNNDYLSDKILNEQGFVKVDKFLRVPACENVFAVGDIAATDPNRSSARNKGYLVVARNIRAFLDGKPRSMKRFRTPPKYRWGSIFGVQKEGMRVYFPNGFGITLGLWVTTWIIFRLIVAEFIYKGVRNFNARAFAGVSSKPHDEE